MRPEPQLNNDRLLANWATHTPHHPAFDDGVVRVS
jgi:hypothetical protein